MECMCAQTRARFILSSERVFWGMESEHTLTPKEKSPLPENFSPKEDRTHDTTSSRTARPTHYQRAFSFSSRWHRNARRGPYALCIVSQQSPQGCPRNSASICLVEHRSFSTLEGGMSAASFLNSSFFQATSAVKLWPVHVQKFPQASEHLCPAKLQTRCDITVSEVSV